MHLLETVQWWTKRSPGTREHLLAADFTYHRGGQAIGRALFLQELETFNGLSDVTISMTLADGDRQAVLFDGVDDVTDLRHQTAWFAELRDGLIVKITNVDMLAFPPGPQPLIA